MNAVQLYQTFRKTIYATKLFGCCTIEPTWFQSASESDILKSTEYKPSWFFYLLNCKDIFFCNVGVDDNLQCYVSWWNRASCSFARDSVYIPFEQVLDAAPTAVQQELLFHLDLFNGKIPPEKVE